jgi:hypothetical protein
MRRAFLYWTFLCVVGLGLSLWAQQPVVQVPDARGGSTVMNATSGDGSTALTSTAQAIKASAGLLTGYYVANPNTSDVFIIVYNIASGSVTVGTSTPAMVFRVPAGTAANVGFTFPITFATAMSWAATSTAGGNGAPTTALDAMAFYQ